MPGWKENGLGVTVAVVVVLLTTLLRPIMIRMRRGTRPRCGTLRIISDPADAKFEIIAVHGLGADPEYTWCRLTPSNAGNGTTMKTHLLQHLLQNDFPEARISSFEHDSKWLTDAPVKTTEEIGKSLLDEIKASRPRRKLPIVFIGHSLGGIIIKQALRLHGSQDIINSVSGIIFLGTPHRGSGASRNGIRLARIFSFLGGDSTVMQSLEINNSQLFNLEQEFKSCIQCNIYRRQKFPTISFYETKPTYLLGLISIGLVVSKFSAVSDKDDSYHYVDSDHSGLNKCAGPEDELYVKLKKEIDSLRAPSLLEQADMLLRNKCYAEDRLRIIRLSGDELPINQCYINLVIVEQIGNTRHEKGDATLSKHSLFARQKVETPDEEHQIALPAIFDERKTRDNRSLEPRRILIRGRAGVGKTTLCKKMVHDFVHGTQTALNRSWTKLFDRLLWVPLRNLKRNVEGQSAVGYNQEHLFYYEYFATQGHDHGYGLAKELWRELAHTDCKRTLFVLDGLDEISNELGRDNGMYPFLMELLNLRNVIITSRPNVSLPPRVRKLDLELETVGFYPDQVDAYLKADHTIKKRANEIQNFLQDRWLMQGLMRIPIQLDALCYAWDDFDSDTTPQTMTCIYNAIELRLWRKDILKIKTDMSETRAKLARPTEIMDKVATEIELLECLAFNGLCDDTIHFTPAHRDLIVPHFKSELFLDDMLNKLSFLRSSDPSTDLKDQNYHFIHLTFQEYFAARYFTRKWRDHKGLEYVFDRKQNPPLNPVTEPVNFLKRHKYMAHYDVFWRFVAGMLDAEEVQYFFEVMEEEPVDLLGPTHQRLVMHCLSEVQSEQELPFRKVLEHGLSKWLLFEYEFKKSVDLAGEIEFPEQALLTALHEGSTAIEKAILPEYIVPAAYSPYRLELKALWLEGKHRTDRCTASGSSQVKQPNVSKQVTIETLDSQCVLPQTNFHSMAPPLDDRHTNSQWAAVNELEGQSYFAKKPSYAVVTQLKETEKDTHLIFAMPENKKDRAKTIATLLEHSDWDVRKVAIEALGSRLMAPDVLRFVAARLGHGNEYVRRAAVQALGSQSVLPEEILQAVAARLEDDHENVRWAAVRSLGRQSVLPEEILLGVAARLGHDDEDVRHAAFQALSRQSVLPEEILQGVVARLENDHEDVRWAAVRSLDRQSVLPEKILQAVAARLGHGNEYVRRAAVQALGSQSVLPEEILQAVAARLENDHENVREAAIETLVSQSVLPEEILQGVVALLGHDDEYVRRTAVQALGNQSVLPEDILQAVVARLEDDDEDVWDAAVEALGSQSVLPEEILQAVAAWLGHDDEDVRRTAVQALGCQPVLPEEILQAVAARLEDDHWYVWKAAIETLVSQSVLPEEILQAVAAWLGHDSEYVRRTAVQALGCQPVLPEEIVQAVAAWLEDDSEYLRRAAVQALGNQSVLPEDILQAVVARLEDDKEYIQDAAELILRQRRDFYKDILSGPHMSLFKILLRFSFSEQLTWYIEDGHSCLNMPGDIRRVPISNHNKYIKLIKKSRPTNYPSI